MHGKKEKHIINWLITKNNKNGKKQKKGRKKRIRGAQRWLSSMQRGVVINHIGF